MNKINKKIKEIDDSIQRMFTFAVLALVPIVMLLLALLFLNITQK
tara:strand:- start:431 stop:565 length:135 start_codon:yes stop_codon:yes gene_type:complete